MPQYRAGTVEVTTNSPTVTAVDPDPADGDISPTQEWAANVSAGDLFVVKGHDIAYIIQTVDSDTQLTLETNYTGPSVSASGTPAKGAEYGIVVDFTDIYNIPLVGAGDVATTVVLQYGMDIIDTQLNILNQRLIALGG